jgi:hypothetical protein
MNLSKLKLRRKLKLKEIKAMAGDNLWMKERRLLVVGDRLELAKERE